MKKQRPLSKLILSSILLFSAFFLFSTNTASAFSLFPAEPSATGKNDDFRTYIVAFYNFALPATALVAVVLIMIGGIIWITSAGDQGRISKAKDFIINPIIGLILLAGVYVILGFINPSFVILQPVTPEPLGTPGACIISETECTFVVTDKDCTGEFVEGTTCAEAQQLKAFEAALKGTEDIAKEKFACEQDDEGHQLPCIFTGLRRIVACADYCRSLGDKLEGSCRPSAAFGNDIECKPNNFYACFCKYEPK